MQAKKQLRLTKRAALLLTLVAVMMTGSIVLQEPKPLHAQAPAAQGPFVGTPIKPGSFDGNLNQLPRAAPSKRPEIFPLRGRGNPVPPASNPPPASPPSQSPPANSNMPGPLQSFDGISFTFAGWPPDPNGDVGRNHYIQAVNISFAVYSKTGTLLAGPTSFDSLWAGAKTSTPCDSKHKADPVVLYDQLADRWILVDLAFDADPILGTPLPPFYACIAVSETNDPVAGGWYLYPLPGGGNLLPDYPKIGLWPDGYYMTANMYDLATNDVNVRIWALDRQAMLSGSPLNTVFFNLPTCAGSAAVCPTVSLLPSNLRGAMPPAGSPNYLASIGTANKASELPFSSNVIHVWKFHVDWNNPQNGSTLTGPTNLPVLSFTEPLVASAGNVAMNIVPQKGTTTRLDTLGDRLMMQAQYRVLPSGTQSLWLAHTIKSGNVTGIRWYEVRITGAALAVQQQGTYDPGDGNFRWLPSLAVDKNGNMAIGYSISSSNLNPGIRYAGRLSTDLPGQLAQGEATLMNGTGSQTDFLSLFTITRWGDYAAMTVDPTDDCTFWYTNEYYTTNGFAWQTRIGSFKLSSCSVAPPAPALYLYLPSILKDFP